MTKSITPLLPKLPTQNKGSVEWTQLYGCARGLAIANAAKLHPGMTVIVTPNILSASHIEYELRFFLQNNESISKTILPVFQFPDRETLPYDLFSPHQDIISERLRALNQLSSLKHGILIVSMSTLMHRLPPRKYLTQHTLILDTGQSLDLNNFRSELEKNGYRCVSQVMVQ